MSDLPAFAWRKSSFSGNNGTCVEIAPLPQLVMAEWRKSSFSADNGACVETAPLTSRHVGVRNSNHPEAGTLLLSRPGVAAWIRGVKAGEYDDLA